MRYYGLTLAETENLTQTKLETLMEGMAAITRFEQKGELPGRQVFRASSLAEARAIMEAHNGVNL